MNVNPFSNPMATLPVFVYYQYVTPGIPQDPFYARAWAGALTLILIVMGLNADRSTHRVEIRPQVRPLTRKTQENVQAH